MRQAIVLLALSGCSRPPPPPSVTEPPRLAAEQGCETTAAMPPLPARPAIDPFRLSHAEDMQMIVDGTSQPLTFLCDLPDQILGIGATQTVDGGKRVVGGVIYTRPRLALARALPARIDIQATSPGCKQGELACVFETIVEPVHKIEMLREQRVHTSGWVHGVDDICRALPDDTIAVCSTQTRMAYVELGCAKDLHLGIHDASVSRVFDLDVEAPVLRMRGQLAAPSAGGAWTFRFRGEPDSTAAPAQRSFATAELAFDPAAKRATLVLDGTSEPCVAWAMYRR